MAVLPTAQSFGRRQSSGAPAPVAQLSRQDAGAVGRAVEGLGETAYESGDMILDREATAAAKERDTYVSDEIRRIMFDPQAGFANLYGREAVSAREKVKEQLEALKSGATKDLNPAARRKLEGTLNRRIESALNRVETHTAAERRSWLKGTSEARIVSTYNDAAAGVLDVSQAFSGIATELRSQGKLEGWGEEVLQVKLDEARSNLVSEQIVRTARDNPEMALDMVRKNSEALLPRTRFDLEAKLQPLADDATGRRLARQAVTGVSHSTQIDFDLQGKQRPNPPAPKLQNLLGVAAERALGTGARVVIYSGQEEQGHQHGSNRHRTGLAADVRVYDASGNLLQLSDPRAQAFMVQAASLGARGIGAGSEYMGDAFHIDMVPHSQYGAGQGPVWGSASKALRDDLLTAMEQPEATFGNVDITKESQGVQDAYYRHVKIARAEAAAQLKAQREAIQGIVVEHLETGGSMSDLDPEVKAQLGVAASKSLYEYEAKVKAGDKVELDHGTYLSLRRMAEEDPAAFAQVDLLEYRDKLPDAQWRSFADMQSGSSAGTKGVAVSTMMTNVKRQLEAAGYDTTPKTGSSGAEAMARAQSQMVLWQDDFISENKRPPTQAEQTEFMGRLLQDFTINPSGAFNEEEGTAFDFSDEEFDERELLDLRRTNGRVRIGGEDVPASVVSDVIDRVQMQGQAVTYQAIINELIALQGERFD